MTASRTLAVLLSWLPALAAASFDPKDFESRIDRAARSGDFVGLAVAVVHGDDVVLLKTWGERAAGSGEPVTPDTVFRVASLSKGFAATLAALLVQEGNLSWDQPVSTAVPRFVLADEAQTRAVTVAHVLSHRVGLPPYAYDNLLEAGTPTPRILERYDEVDLLCAVGECYTYQNVAFNMIVDVIERAGGDSFEDLLGARIFAPLGLSSASLGREALQSSGNWARPHVRRRNGPWRPTGVDEAYYNVPAAGGINASLADMVEWLRAQLGSHADVLDENVLAAVHTPRVSTRAETRRMRLLRGRLNASHYGYGWRIYDYAGHTVVNHSGGVRGYMAQIALLPEQDAGLVVMANTRTRRAWRILPTFLDAQLGLKDRDWLMLADLDTGTGAAAAAR